jgi:hypothetical protein
MPSQRPWTVIKNTYFIHDCIKNTLGLKTNSSQIVNQVSAVAASTERSLSRFATVSQPKGLVAKGVLTCRKLKKIATLGLIARI